MVRRSTGRSSIAAAAYHSANKIRSERDGVTHDYSVKSSSVNAAAYRSGESLSNEQFGEIHDYTFKRGVVYSEILLPENAPQEYQDRSTLWNAVEKSERRKDAQTARDIDIALPVELNRQEQITLTRDFVRDNFADKGMCADFSIHDKGDGNPHVHVLLSTRDVTENGFGGKNRDWNLKSYLKSWRENWADSCNELLQTKGLDDRIDHRTLKAQGIDREPTIHTGVAAKHMEQRGIEHPLVKANKEIKARNEERAIENTAKHMHQLKEDCISLDKDISSLQEESAEAVREMNSARIKAEEITVRTKQIQDTRQRLEELRAGRQPAQQIQQLERSNEQATAYFKRTYNIDPAQASAEVTRLEATATSKKRLHEKLQDKLTPLVEEKSAVILEYQRQKLLAELSPNEQRILDELAKLDQEPFSHGRSVQDNLARVRCQRELDTITEHNFQEILKQAPSDKAQGLTERWEREKFRTFQRERS